jgi:filamentous hemagglutinin family protein
MSYFWNKFKALAVAISFTITIPLPANSATLQIIPDATLANNSCARQQDSTRLTKGVTPAESNLIRSFEQFFASRSTTANLKNTVDIENIINQVTAKSISNVDAILYAKSEANLLLVNPSKIIFDTNASPNIGSSYVESGVGNVNFAGNTKFSVTVQQTKPFPIFTLPMGLRFGANVDSIHNQPQTSPNSSNYFGYPVGLQEPKLRVLIIEKEGFRIAGCFACCKCPPPACCFGICCDS